MTSKPEKPRLTAVEIQAHGVFTEGEFERPIRMSFVMEAKDYATFDLQKAMEERHAEEMKEATKTPAARKVELQKARRQKPKPRRK